MVRLASVEFTKLKNVRPGTRLVFAEAGAVLLGKNGTGKTTLLEYLVALCTADINAFVSDEPFDVSASFVSTQVRAPRCVSRGRPTLNRYLFPRDHPTSRGCCRPVKVLAWNT